MNKWIKHDGEERPVSYDTIVRVQYVDGTRDSMQDVNGDWAGHWEWDQGQGDKTIAFYEIVEDGDKYVEVPVVSDGGSTSYYALTITNKAGEDISCEMGDVIRAVVGNDFDLGNVLKACRRMYEASQGRGKKDVTMHYDANKIAYFSKEFADWNEDSE